MEIKLLKGSIRYSRLLFQCILLISVQGFSFSEGIAQQPNWLVQDSLNFLFGWKSMEILETDSSGKWVVSPAKSVVGLKLRQDQISELNSWDSRTWLLYLKRKKTSYVTNLILYALTER